MKMTEEKEVFFRNSWNLIFFINSKNIIIFFLMVEYLFVNIKNYATFQIYSMFERKEKS